LQRTPAILLEKPLKLPQFCRFCSRTGPEKVSHFKPQASFVAPFSEGPIGSPVSKTPYGECNAITQRRFGESGLTFVGP